MNDTWIKLYRKVMYNDIMQDPIAYTLFNWILMSVDRRTGEYTTGRIMLAEALNQKPTTIYYALKRLEKKYKVLTLSSNNKFTTISVLHWAKYQSNEVTSTQDIDNNSTTTRQQLDTKQELRSKELRNNTDVLAKPAVVADLDPINKLISLFSEVNPNYKTLYSNKTQRGALDRMVKEHGSEKIQWAIKILVKSNSMPYAPTITTPLELEKKLGSLIAFLQKKKGDMQPKIAVVS